MYAIIEDSGTQIKVAPGDVVQIDLRDDAAPGKTIVFDRVLAIGGDGGGPARLGTPYLPNAKVSAEVVEEFADRKITTHKFARRKGYHRKLGHRQSYLLVKIGDVNG